MHERLYEKLEAYDQQGIYPCHMPGHKRQLFFDTSMDCVKMDITEIEGFDNLHHPTEILKEEEERAARIYGARKTFFLVNGSTCGNLSAICACVKRKGTVLVARNCHKSVYHALYLNECKVKYLIPEMIDELSLVGGITPESVEDALNNNKDIQAVMITSPTYDGVVSDVSGIASVVHRFGIPLIVDEAHGAHFGLDASYPKNALQNGADVVIHSLHKTLPSFTQTALLHVQGDIVDDVRIAQFQSMFQSTSPSYLLLASISKCLKIMEEEASTKIKQMETILDDFYKKVENCRCLKVLNQKIIGENGVYDFDRTKIVISTIDSDINGEELYEILLNQYKIQMEMTANDYCQAIMTFMDKKEGFDRLSNAILSIDQMLFHRKHTETEKEKVVLGNIYQEDLLPRSISTIYDAQESAWEWVQLTEAGNRIMADYIMLYPPGIPLLTPGECIEEKHIGVIQALCERKLNVIGVEDGKIKVIV